MYESELCDANQVDDFLKVVNEEGYRIVSMIYLTDSNQILTVVEKNSGRRFFEKDKITEER